MKKAGYSHMVTYITVNKAQKSTQKHLKKHKTSNKTNKNRSIKQKQRDFSHRTGYVLVDLTVYVSFGSATAYNSTLEGRERLSCRESYRICCLIARNRSILGIFLFLITRLGRLSILTLTCVCAFASFVISRWLCSREPCPSRRVVRKMCQSYV